MAQGREYFVVQLLEILGDGPRLKIDRCVFGNPAVGKLLQRDLAAVCAVVGRIES